MARLLDLLIVYYLAKRYTKNGLTARLITATTTASSKCSERERSREKRVKGERIGRLRAIQWNGFSEVINGESRQISS